MPKRRKAITFDIENIVIPKSIKASVRIEKIKCKEILTPDWRIVDKDLHNKTKSAVCDEKTESDIKKAIEDNSNLDKHMEKDTTKNGTSKPLSNEYRQINKMKQSKKGTKSSKIGTSFIKLTDKKVDYENAKSEEEPQTTTRKFIVSGSKEAAKSRGVVYVSRIPHGFYEKEMRRYFQQFGHITNLKMGRSIKTGASRGYAFVEFQFQEVAKTVAETMNNYLFFDKLMKCELVAEETVRPTMFRNKINPKKPPLKKARCIAKQQVNMKRDEEQEQRRRRKQLQKLKKTAAKLKKIGVEYSVDLPSIEKEILDRKARLKATSSEKPNVQIVDSDLNVTLKGTSNVQNIRSKSNAMPTLRNGSMQIFEASIIRKKMKKRQLVIQEGDDGKIFTPPANKADVRNTIEPKNEKKNRTFQEWNLRKKNGKRNEPIKKMS